MLGSDTAPAVAAPVSVPRPPSTRRSQAWGRKASIAAARSSPTRSAFHTASVYATVKAHAPVHQLDASRAVSTSAPPSHARVPERTSIFAA